jgi:hypothetical protein
MNTDDPVIDEPGAEPPNEPVGTTEVTSDLPEALTAAAAVNRPSPPPVPDAHAIAGKLRAEFSEIATVAAQAARLGLDIDAADAMRRGLKPDALRRTILEKLAARSDAADVVAIAPQPPTGSAGRPSGDSPIVKRARERAAASSR